MTDVKAALDALRRPGLLIRAARFGIADYRRERDLARLIGSIPAPEPAMARLMLEEARMEAMRATGSGAYALARHIELLIALLAEARHVPAEEAALRAVG